MTWIALYPWLLVLHVSSALAFLAVHGVSMGVWWRVRHERDRTKLVPLLELSSSFMTPMFVVGLVLILSGILVGVAAAWWFNGQWWLWASIGLLVLIVLLMHPLLGVPMFMIRRALGIADPVRPQVRPQVGGPGAGRRCRAGSAVARPAPDGRRVHRDRRDRPDHLADGDEAVLSRGLERRT